MSTQKILLSVGAIILVVAIFLLPKVVVDSEGSEVEEGEGQSEIHTEGDGHDHEDPAMGSNNNAIADAHDVEVSESSQKQINNLRENLFASNNKEKSAIFADSLAVLFKQINRLDSAAKYSAIAADFVPGQENWLKAGNSNYEAFSFALDAEKAQHLGEEARRYFEKVLAENPGMLEVKTKLAMTYISTENPMKGIQMLLDVVKQDPENEQALFNLGILSMQSGQYEKAIERFEKIIALYPNNVQAQFYLGVSYYEDGKEDKAREQFEKVKKLDNDPAVQASVESYLEEMN